MEPEGVLIDSYIDSPYVSDVNKSESAQRTYHVPDASVHGVVAEVKAVVKAKPWLGLFVGT